MKITLLLIGIILIAIIFNIFNYSWFLFLLSIIWYVASILIIYLVIKLLYRYKFKLISIKKIILAIKSKSKNNISPLSSLCVSLAAKIGVGSLSGIALAIYFGGIGTIFWLVIISLLLSINTYIECVLGFKYREKVFNRFIGGPSYYIKKCLGNKYLALLYSILIIITYGGLFLSIQTNTIVSITNNFMLDKNYVIIILVILTLIIISNGINGISKVNKFLVPIMLIIYALIGVYIFINYLSMVPLLCLNILKEAFKLNSIIPVFLIGMQRAIFITESSLGTSAISASSCDNNADKQAMLEVLGIYIIVFIICLTTFMIIVTSNYQLINFKNLNGIEIVIYAFNYHFGSYGKFILSFITVLFAFSTIISSYFFSDSNITTITSNYKYNLLYKIFFILIIIISGYLKANILWNLTDFLIAILVIINVSSIIRIIKDNNV